MDVVLIPAYEPDNELVKLTEGLVAKGFSVLVVDDGSGERFAPFFDKVRNNATVLTHEQNRGKGAALKTGMRHIRDHMPECKYFVTCDADGQHRIEDVIRVTEKLHDKNKFVLTIRERKNNTKVPLRSKIGNNLSRFVYAMLTNRYLSDNQSGLRGFAVSHIDWMVNVEKDKYDYEMNVLYYAAKMGLKVCTLPIEAIYIGNNESSHFNPIADTVRIYKSLFLLSRGTFFSFVAAEILVTTCSFLLGYNHLFLTMPGIAALTYLICILLNRYLFFKNVPNYDYWATLVFTVISYFFYTILCVIFYLLLPQVPLIIAFNIIFLICIPLRYMLHKFIFIASLTKD